MFGCSVLGELSWIEVASSVTNAVMFLSIIYLALCGSLAFQESVSDCET